MKYLNSIEKRKLKIILFLIILMIISIILSFDLYLIFICIPLLIITYFIIKYILIYKKKNEIIGHIEDKMIYENIEKEIEKK